MESLRLEKHRWHFLPVSCLLIPVCSVVSKSRKYSRLSLHCVHVYQQERRNKRVKSCEKTRKQSTANIITHWCLYELSPKSKCYTEQKAVDTYLNIHISMYLWKLLPIYSATYMQPITVLWYYMFYLKITIKLLQLQLVDLETSQLQHLFCKLQKYSSITVPYIPTVKETIHY